MQKKQKKLNFLKKKVDFNLTKCYITFAPSEKTLVFKALGDEMIFEN